MLPKEYANGDKYDGWWYNGSSATLCISLKPRGFSAHRLRGQCSGLGVYFFADGSQYQGAWNHGKYDSWTQPTPACFTDVFFLLLSLSISLSLSLSLSLCLSLLVSRLKLQEPRRCHGLVKATQIDIDSSENKPVTCRDNSTFFQQGQSAEPSAASEDGAGILYAANGDRERLTYFEGAGGGLGMR